MKAFIVLSAIAAVLALPGALAVVSTGDQTAAAEQVVGVFAPLAPAPLPALPTDQMPVYYIDDSGNVWQESNGHAGLQETQTCDKDGKNCYAPDTLVFSLSTLGAPGMPVLPAAPGIPSGIGSVPAIPAPDLSPLQQLTTLPPLALPGF